MSIVQYKTVWSFISCFCQVLWVIGRFWFDVFHFNLYSLKHNLAHHLHELTTYLCKLVSKFTICRPIDSPTFSVINSFLFNKIILLLSPRLHWLRAVRSCTYPYSNICIYIYSIYYYRDTYGRIIFWAHFFRICLVTKPDPRWRPSVAKQLTVIFTARNSTEIPLR
jgi:hypothetical protein